MDFFSLRMMCKSFLDLPLFVILLRSWGILKTRILSNTVSSLHGDQYPASEVSFDIIFCNYNIIVLTFLINLYKFVFFILLSWKAHLGTINKVYVCMYLPRKYPDIF